MGVGPGWCRRQWATSGERDQEVQDCQPRDGRGWGWAGLGRGRAYHGGEVSVLPAARSNDALPQLQRDVGDVVGAGDGGAVQRRQVGWLDRWPACRLQVDHHQLLLGQHHKGIGVVKGWGTGQGSGPRSKQFAPAWPCRKSYRVGARNLQVQKSLFLATRANSFTSREAAGVGKQPSYVCAA